MSIFTIKIRKQKWEIARTNFLKEIESCFLQGMQEVEVLHGIGEYRLREMILQEVEKIDYVEVISLPSVVAQNPGTLRLKILAPEKSIMEKYLK